MKSYLVVAAGAVLMITAKAFPTYDENQSMNIELPDPVVDLIIDKINSPAGIAKGRQVNKYWKEKLTRSAGGHTCDEFRDDFVVDRNRRIVTFKPFILRDTLRGLMGLNKGNANSGAYSEDYSANVDQWLQWGMHQMQVNPYTGRVSGSQANQATDAVFDGLKRFRRCVDSIAAEYSVTNFKSKDIVAFKRLSNDKFTPKTNKFVHPSIQLNPYQFLQLGIMKAKEQQLHDRALGMALLQGDLDGSGTPHSPSDNPFTTGLAIRLIPTRQQGISVPIMLSMYVQDSIPMFYISDETEFERVSRETLSTLKMIPKRTRYLCTVPTDPVTLSVQADNEIILDGLLNGMSTEDKCECKENYVGPTNRPLGQHVSEYFDSLGC